MIAVVTGASGGLGAAIRAALEERGHQVVDWSRTAGVDLADPEAITAAASRLESWDVLVNNAAVLLPALVADMSRADWDRTLAVGLSAVFHSSQQAFRRMPAGGAIVNVSSLSGWWGAEKFAGMAAYVAAKSGLAGLTEVLAVEGRKRGIRVNAVSPGSIATPMLERSGAPKEPALRPVDVARVVAWLACPESAPLTGSNIRLSTG